MTPTMFSRDEALILATFSSAGFLGDPRVRAALSLGQSKRLNALASAGSAILQENPDHVRNHEAIEVFLSALEKITLMAHRSQLPDPLGG